MSAGIPTERQHRAKALASMVAVIVTSGVIASPASALAARCEPAVVVTGDADAAKQVSEALTRLGVGAPGTDRDCVHLTATVTRELDGLALTLQTGQRTERRVVADATLAASWIESWVHDEAAPLWTAAPPVAVSPPSLVAVQPRPTQASARRGRPGVSVLLARDLDPDDASWDGVAADACYERGAWCAGIAARYVTTTTYQSRDPDGGAGGTTAARRASLVIAATAERRFQVGPIEIAPRLVVGLARTTSRRHEPEPPCFGGCTQTITYVGDGFTATNYAARVGSGLGVRLPLAAWLVLDGKIGFERAIDAHPTPHRHDPARYPLAGQVAIAPGDPLLDLPGDPAWLVTAGFGLRVEVP